MGLSLPNDYSTNGEIWTRVSIHPTQTATRLGFVTYSSVILLIPAQDKQTDRLTDMPTIANTALADAL